MKDWSLTAVHDPKLRFWPAVIGIQVTGMSSSEPQGFYSGTATRNPYIG